MHGLLFRFEKLGNLSREIGLVGSLQSFNHCPLPSLRLIFIFPRQSLRIGSNSGPVVRDKINDHHNQGSATEERQSSIQKNARIFLVSTTSHTLSRSLRFRRRSVPQVLPGITASSLWSTPIFVPSHGSSSSSGGGCLLGRKGPRSRTWLVVAVNYAWVAGA